MGMRRRAAARQIAETYSEKRLSTRTASTASTSCAGSAGSAPLSLLPRRVAMVFSPSASSRISDTEAVPPAARVAPAQSMPSAIKSATMRLLVASSSSPSGPANRTLRPEARGGDGRIGGAAAAGDDEIGGVDFGAGRREGLHAHDDVLHGNAGAEDRRAFRPFGALSQS